MSVFVKGMELPKDCRECPMEFYRQFCGDTMCLATDRTLAEDHKIIPFDGRPDWCPLVEIPVPHGRLIDVDALEADICPDWNGLYVPDNAYSEKLIRNAPTVIEAEGSDDHADD